MKISRLTYTIFIVLIGGSIFSGSGLAEKQPYEFCSRVYSNYLEVKNCQDFMAFLDALRSGDKAVIKVLLENGVNLNYFDGANMTLVHAVAEQKDVSILALIINYGADVNAQKNNGPTPIISAANLEDNVAMIEELFKRGANLSSVDEDNYTAIHRSLRHKSKKNLEAILKLGIDPDFSVNGYTALAHSIIARDIDAVELLLKYGANPDADFENGELVWQLALGKPEILQALKK